MYQLYRWFVGLAFLLALVMMGVGSAQEQAEVEPSTKSADDSSPDNAGLDDLDKATQLRISADSMADLEQIVRHCESAIQRGLDEENTTFAKQLLVATIFERAKRYCQPIFERRPPDPRWARLRTMAMTDLEKLLEYDDQQMNAHLLVAQLQSLPGGDRKRADLAVETAVKVAGDDPEKRSKALARRASLSEDREKQLADLDDAIQIAPQNLAALRQRGLIYFEDGQFEQAIADFRKILEKDGGDTASMQAIAESLVRLKKHDEAIEYLNRAVEDNPDSVANYMLRARALFTAKKSDEALKDLDKAVELQPRNVTALLFRAELHDRLGNVDLASRDVERVLALVPDLPEAILMRASLAARTGNFKDAIANIRVLLRLNPDSVELRAQLATYVAADGRPKQAVEIYSEILVKQPNNWSALRGRANVLLSIGKHAEAIADFDAALEKHPDDDNILNNLAWVLATSPKDDLRDGQRSLELALKACEVTDYQEAHILSTLAAAYAEMGDFETAIRWSTKAVEQETGDDKEQLTQELDSYKNKKPWRELQQTEEKQEADRPQESDLQINDEA